MKQLVCISKVPDTTTKIKFTNNDTEFDQTGVNYIVNPYDEWYALVRALELKEQIGGTVTILNVGLTENDAIIRKALAIGADDAVRIDVEPVDDVQVATEIAAYAKDKQYDLLFFGKESIDFNGSIVPGLVAELLQLPYISFVEKLELDGQKVQAERTISGGIEQNEVDLPLVVSAQKGLAEQRIPNMRGIMQARTKPLTVIASCGAKPTTSIINFEQPKEKGSCEYIDAENPGILWDKLKNEAKVL